MWNETVARAIVAERVAAADRAARVRRLDPPAPVKPHRPRRTRWGVLLRIRASPSAAS